MNRPTGSEPQVRILRNVRTKAGLAFTRGEIVSMEPGDPFPGIAELADCVSCFSVRNNIWTAVKRTWVAPVSEGTVRS